MKQDKKTQSYKEILNNMINIASNAKQNALIAVNIELLKRNWLLGKEINDAILTNYKDDYGKQLIKKLSFDLSKLGNGFKQQRLYEYLRFYKTYKNIFQTVSGNSFLPWSHYSLLSYITNKAEREWYESEALKNLWSFRQLKRAINTKMYNRLIPNQIVDTNKHLINVSNTTQLKSLMIFEFLGFKHNDKYGESQLEEALINNLTRFMLELGNGYNFTARQYHLRTKGNDYYIDLVFYNTILKRYLLIDLKVGKIKHQDYGQMKIYLDLFDEQNNIDVANRSIGMILSSDLNGDIVKYLMKNDKNYVVASKYLTYLPTKEEIRRELEKIYKYK